MFKPSATAAAAASARSTVHHPPHASPTPAVLYQQRPYFTNQSPTFLRVHPPPTTILPNGVLPKVVVPGVPVGGVPGLTPPKPPGRGAGEESEMGPLSGGFRRGGEMIGGGIGGRGGRGRPMERV